MLVSESKIIFIVVNLTLIAWCVAATDSPTAQPTIKTQIGVPSLCPIVNLALKENALTTFAGPYCGIYMCPGQYVAVSGCPSISTPGVSCSGDPLSALVDAEGYLLAYNDDDSACPPWPGMPSSQNPTFCTSLNFTVPHSWLGCQVVTLKAGCYGNGIGPASNCSTQLMVTVGTGTIGSPTPKPTSIPTESPSASPSETSSNEPTTLPTTTLPPSPVPSPVPTTVPSSQAPTLSPYRKMAAKYELPPGEIAAAVIMSVFGFFCIIGICVCCLCKSKTPQPPSGPYPSAFPDEDAAVELNRDSSI